MLVLALQSFHIRMGTPNTPDLVKLRNGDIITTDIALSIQGDQLVKVIKEEVLPTALVRGTGHLINRHLTTDPNILRLG